MKVYILFSSWNRSGNTDIRKTEGVFGSLKLAQQVLLDDLKKILEYEGNIFQIVPDFIVLDEENTNHDGGILKSTDPDFRCVTIQDTNDCPEAQFTWEIEESEVIDSDLRSKAERDLDELARLLSHKGYANGHTLCLKGKNIFIQQFLDGKGYLDVSDPFEIESIGLDEWGRVEVAGKWGNRTPDKFVLLYHYDEDYCETSWWNLPDSFLTLISDTQILRSWDIVFDEEYPDTNGYCGSAIISNGIDYLFAQISRDNDEVIEHCTIRSELLPMEGTEMIRFPWTAENESLLLACLNDNSTDPDLIGDNSPLYSLVFKPAPNYVLARLHFKETPEISETLLIKLSTDVAPDEDDKIFYYCNGVRELETLKDPDNGQDFVIEAWDPTDSIYDE